VITDATPADARQIADIWNVIIRDTIATFTTAEKTPQGVAKAMARQPFFVARAGPTITGFATYFPFRGGPGYAHTMEHSIHVPRQARGRGLGRALMAHVEAHASAAGVHSIFAAISGENSDAIAFHAALGYSQTARLPQVGRKFGRWHDLVLMQKFL
jgi:L-amino acid N-acyltransferase